MYHVTSDAAVAAAGGGGASSDDADDQTTPDQVSLSILTVEFSIGKYSYGFYAGLEMVSKKLGF